MKIQRKRPERADKVPERAKKRPETPGYHPRIFPQVFEQGFFLRFLDRKGEDTSKSARESTKRRPESARDKEKARESITVQERCQRVLSI